MPQANGVQLKAGLPDKAQGQYQTVLANILATPLKVLAPLLCAAMWRQAGTLVLAGILERQEAELKQAYAPLRCRPPRLRPCPSPNLSCSKTRSLNTNPNTRPRRWS
jgi:hypothetical protein